MREAGEPEGGDAREEGAFVWNALYARACIDVTIGFEATK